MLTDKQIFDIGCILWSQRSDAIRDRDRVQHLENDGTPDWDQFQRIRRCSAQDNVTRTSELFDAFKETYREQLTRVTNL